MLLDQLSESQKVLLNALTAFAWVLGVVISLVAVAKGRTLQKEAGVSLKTYFVLVGVTEILYVIGAMMILSAMGINTLRHLANLEFWQFYRIMEHFDWTTVKLVGVVGWIGFALNRSVSFLSPGYLLFFGKERLPRYFRLSAWTEIGLETVMTALIFVSLTVG